MGDIEQTAKEIAESMREHPDEWAALYLDHIQQLKEANDTIKALYESPQRTMH